MFYEGISFHRQSFFLKKSFKFLLFLHYLPYFSFVTNSSILHDPPKLNDSSAHWQFETGIMGPATNIHVLFESVRTKDGVSANFAILTWHNCDQ